jgi:peptidyl-prolyl cis-trans isomerase C
MAVSATGGRTGGARIGGLAALIAVAALTLAACGKTPSFERPPEPGDKAAATVNGQTVWASDVKREAVAQGLIGEGEPLDVSSDLFRQVLDEVVDQKLLAAEAVKRRIDRQPLAQRRMAAARERILGDMLVETVVAKAVNDSAIQTLYQEQLKLSKTTDEIHARQIVVATAADGEAVRKLLATGASFEALAMERSNDPATRFNGGDLGYFTTDIMPEAYGAALKDAKTGDVVGPFPVEGGFAVVKIEDRRAEQPITLEQARPQIVRFLTYDEVRDLLERLRAKAKVKVLVRPPDGIPGAPTEPASAPPGALDHPAAPEAPASAPASGTAPAVALPGALTPQSSAPASPAPAAPAKPAAKPAAKAPALKPAIKAGGEARR